MESIIKDIIILMLSISAIHIVVEGLYHIIGYGDFQYNLRDFIIYMVVSIVYGVWSNN